MNECGSCELWDGRPYVMKIYGEGVGVCTLDGSVRFCSHKCPFKIKEEEDSADEVLRS